MENQKSFGFFSARTERLFLLFPFAIAGLLFFSFILNPSSFSEANYTINILVDIFLFDATHTILSWSLLLLPEALLWRKKMDDGGAYFFLRMAFVAIGMIVLFSVIFSPLVLKFSFIALPIIFLPTHHTVSQIRGISFIYNRIWCDNNPHLVVEDLFRKSRRLETWASYFLIGTVFMKLSAIIAIPRFYPKAFTITFLLLLAVSLCLWTWALALLPKELRHRKTVYLSRLAMMPLSIFTVWANAAMQAIHGIEYIFVFRKVLNESSCAPERKRKILYLSVGAFVIVGILVAGKLLSDWLAPWLTISTSVVTALLILRTANTYTHYWADSIIWKMSHAANRKHIAPLLLKIAK